MPQIFLTLSWRGIVGIKLLSLVKRPQFLKEWLYTSVIASWRDVHSESADCTEVNLCLHFFMSVIRSGL